MKGSSIRINRAEKTATIVIPLEPARPSKSTGRTMVIATTRGLKESAETYSRRPVWFTANVLFYPVNSKRKSNEGSAAADGKSPRIKPRARDPRE
jgi:hypothetical protein